MICFNLLRRLAFAGLAITAAPLFAADVTSTWGAATSGVWNIDGNWLNVPVLGGFPNNGNGGVATYDAVISATGSPYTVTLSTNITVEDLTLSSANATINQTAGTFTATGALEISAGAYQLNGGTISNTVINQSGTGSLLISAFSANLLSGVTVNGDLNLNTTDARTKIAGGTTFNTAHLAEFRATLGFAPGQTLAGMILFEGANTNVRAVEMNGTSGSFTIGPTGIIRTEAGFAGSAQIGPAFWYGGSMTLLNAGLISSQTSGKTVTVAPASFTNTGTIEAIGGGILSIPNGYTQNAGVTRVNNGTITNSTINSSTINLVAGTLVGNGTINATVNSSGIINLDSGGMIVGPLNVTGGSWNGQGIVTGLATASSGTFTIGSGAHMRANAGLNVTGTGVIAATDGTAKITGSVSYLSSSNSTFGGIIAGAGKTLTMNNAAATLTLSGANTYTGATTVTAGILKAGIVSVSGASGAFGRNSAVTMANSASATLDITGFDTQIGSLSGGGTSGGNVLLGAATLTFGGNNTSPTVYGGTISGTGGLALRLAHKKTRDIWPWIL